MPRIQPAEQSRTYAADMQQARGTRSESCHDSHTAHLLSDTLCVIAIPTQGLLEALFKIDLGAPAQGIHFGNIEQLARRSVGLGFIESECTWIAHLSLNELGKLANRNIVPPADIDQTLIAVVLHQIDARVGKI